MPLPLRAFTVFFLLQADSVASVHERSIPTERPSLVGEVNANFADRAVSRSQRGGSPTAVI
jgi:hypothetical protein